MDANDGGAEAQIQKWVEAHLGPVRAVRRQERWRPSWYVDLIQGTRPMTVYVRGSRGGDWPPKPLDYEYRVHRVFEEHGLRVPRLFGYIDSVPAIVMEMLPGRANLRFADSESARESIRNQLIDQMVRMHSLDPDLLRAAGAHEPEDPVRRAMSYFDQAERIYLRAKSRPQPFLEFARKWMARHPPEVSPSPEVVAVDAGQFMFDGDRLTGLNDFEMVGLGDRYTDLGALRTRDRAEYIGDLNEFYSLYARRAGIELDMKRLRYHALAIALLTPLMISGQLSNPGTVEDHYLYQQWWGNNCKEAIEQLAEMLGIDLPVWSWPKPGRSGRYDTVFEDLSVWFRSRGEHAGATTYEMDRKHAHVGFLQRVSIYQHEFEIEYWDDIAKLTGTRPRELDVADSLLEAFVSQARPEHDADLLCLFYRQIQRHVFLMNDPEVPNPRFASRIPSLHV